MKIISQLPAMPGPCQSAFIIAGPQAYQVAMCLLCRFGDNVDDPVHCIDAPEGGSRAANDLNAVHIFHEQIMLIPYNACIQRSVETPAIHEHQELTRRIAVESPGSYGPCVAVHPRHMKPRNHTQGLGDVADTRTADVFLSDNKHGCCCMNLGLFLFPGDGYFHIHQISQRKCVKRIISLLSRHGPGNQGNQRKKYI